MKIVIKTHHDSTSSALKGYAEEKLSKLDKFFDHIQDVVIDLNVQAASKPNEQQVASATIHAAGTTIHAEESSKSMYASIDGLIDKLEVQLKKYKEKMRDHHRSESEKYAEPKVSAPSISTVKERFIPKPIEIEEAGRICAEENLKFLAFRNIENERICVIHPVATGEFELIET
jgi:putative sigma-54 modulation protein